MSLKKLSIILLSFYRKTLQFFELHEIKVENVFESLNFGDYIRYISSFLEVDV